jgi:hypothetical protein
VSKLKHINGKAADQWNPFSLPPLFAADLVSDGAECWRLHILCTELSKIVFAPAIDPDWLSYLEVLISEHYELLAQTSLKLFTHKIHFMIHYPRLTLAYGPFRHMW